MASSSSSSSTSCDHINKRYQYDVFLSFSGEDTRRSFVDHLNEALQRHGIRTFKDDERLQKGKEIKEELMKSIEDSRFCVIVFSKKYASSSWCLDELLKIMECHETTDQTAFPVFYDVEPTEVRKQSGSVGEAFAKHNHTKKVIVGKTLTRNITKKALTRHTKKRLGEWRKALKDAANLCGWELKNNADGHEAKVIKLIVERISLELRSINMGADENLIGMEKRMQALDSYLEIGKYDVRMIGIWGMGGAGKTTLARAIFDKISINFEGTSFVEDVRENSKAPGLKKLQEQVLEDVLKDKSISVSSVHKGTNLIKTMLCGKKVLVVLDDVDDKDQLEALADDPNWFKPGSRIIVTTRDEQVLIAHGIEMIQQVDLLSDKEAVRLFCKHAFRDNIPTQEYEIQSLDQVVRYAAGLPLTIKVLGSFLCGKGKSEWIDALARLKKIPLKETIKKLELSYDSLEDEYKEIFLDVACFLRDWEEEKAIRMLESCGYHARNGLRVLEQKSLLKTSKYTDDATIDMHDHLVEMAKNIVRRGHLDEPNKHSRLWDQKEIEQVMADNSVNEATKCIALSTPGIFLEGLGNMKKLRCLIVPTNIWSMEHLFACVMIEEGHLLFPDSLRYLDWSYYPLRCLPKTFEANNLVTLEMPKSEIEQLWEEGKVMKKLKFLNLSRSKLRSLDLGLTPNLERLNLVHCKNLVELNVHGGCLKSLVYLNLDECRRLKSISFIEQLESLEVLCISKFNMREIQNYIMTGQSNNSLVKLHLSSNEDIEEIPSSIGNLLNLVSLRITDCDSLKSLPRSIWSLQHLTTLVLSNIGIEELPEELGQLKRLKTLSLTGCPGLKKLPEGVGELESLEILDLYGCYNLREIPSSICKLKHLKVLDLVFCERLEKLPDEVGNLGCLQSLDISNTGITHLPHSTSLIKGLEIERS